MVHSFTGKKRKRRRCFLYRTKFIRKTWQITPRDYVTLRNGANFNHKYTIQLMNVQNLTHVIDTKTQHTQETEWQ